MAATARAPDRRRRDRPTARVSHRSSHASAKTPDTPAVEGARDSRLRPADPITAQSRWKLGRCCRPAGNSKLHTCNPHNDQLARSSLG